MLVLTRKQNEKICIGDEIIVTVLRTKGKGVRLGIEAPAHIPVLRGELAFETPAEDSRPEAASADRTVEPAPRKIFQPGVSHPGTAPTNGLQQPAASHWPAYPVNRTASTGVGTARKPAPSCQEDSLRGLAKGRQR